MVTFFSSASFDCHFPDSLEDLEAMPCSTIQLLFGKASTHHISKKDVLTIGRLADLVKRGRSSGLNAVKSGGLKLNGVRYTDVDEKVDYEKLKFGGKDLTIVCWGKRHFDLVVWSE